MIYLSFWMLKMKTRLLRIISLIFPSAPVFRPKSDRICQGGGGGSPGIYRFLDHFPVIHFYGLQLRLILYQTKTCFFLPQGRKKKNSEGIGKNAGYQHFLLFPQCFLFLPWFIANLAQFSPHLNHYAQNN